MIDRVDRAVSDTLPGGTIVGLLGGEHSITVGAVRAFRRRRADLSVLYLDAHADMRDEYQGSPWSHACVALRVLEMCPLVEVGVRSLSEGRAPLHCRRGRSRILLAQRECRRRRHPATGDGTALRHRVRQHRPRRPRSLDHVRRWDARARRHVLARGHHPAPTRRREEENRRLRHRGAEPRRGSRSVRIHRRQAGLQADRLRDLPRTRLHRQRVTRLTCRSCFGYTLAEATVGSPASSRLCVCRAFGPGPVPQWRNRQRSRFVIGRLVGSSPLWGFRTLGTGAQPPPV